jgi:Crp-like helix-turn-helix domain
LGGSDTRGRIQAVHRRDRRIIERPHTLIPAASDPRRNRLLAALPDTEWRRWSPHLEALELPLGTVLSESGRSLSHVYFPTTAIVSLAYAMHDGSSGEVAVVGNDGVVGVSLFLGGGSMLSKAVVRSAGLGFRLSARVAMEEFNGSPVARRLLLHYTQVLITQMAQTAVCNRHHSIDQQMCRLLLLTLDRLHGNELVMTHELAAELLGVRREGVTEAAGRLQKDGVIHYARGRITVLDRRALEERVCECYSVVKKEYSRLLPDRPAK